MFSNSFVFHKSEVILALTQFDIISGKYYHLAPLYLNTDKLFIIQAIEIVTPSGIQTWDMSHSLYLNLTQIRLWDTKNFGNHSFPVMRHSVFRYCTQFCRNCTFLQPQKNLDIQKTLLWYLFKIFMSFESFMNRQCHLLFMMVHFNLSK